MGKQTFIVIQFILVLNTFVYRGKACELQDHYPCNNPNGNLGSCMPISECPSLFNVLNKNQIFALDFVSQSRCQPPNDHETQLHVCCTSDKNFAIQNSSNDEVDMEKTNYTTTEKPDFSLFPKPPVCGPVFVANRIYGGEETALGEFPWLAILEYTKDYLYICNGNIINERYILTAAHCVKGEVETIFGKIIAVRLGVKNVLREAVQRLNIEEEIVHADYALKHPLYSHYNDIALLRTDQNIRYSKYVAPICLPGVFTEGPELEKDMKLYVAGWGKTEFASGSIVKLKVEVPYVDSADCSPLPVAPSQLCAGGEEGKDSCNGDSGAGLVRFVENAWIIEGIVSYGVTCAWKYPAVYTRISSYMSWITVNVKT